MAEAGQGGWMIEPSAMGGAFRAAGVLWGLAPVGEASMKTLVRRCGAGAVQRNLAMLRALQGKRRAG